MLRNSLISFLEDISEVTVCNILKNLLAVEQISLPKKEETNSKASEKMLFEHFERGRKQEFGSRLDYVYSPEESVNYNQKIKEYYYPNKYIPMQTFMVSPNQYWENFYGKLYLTENNSQIKGHPHHAIGPRFFAKCLYNIERGDLIIAADCPAKDKYICLFINFICNKLKKESIETIFQLLETNQQIFKQKIIEFVNSKNEHILRYPRERDIKEAKEMMEYYRQQGFLGNSSEEKEK